MPKKTVTPYNKYELEKALDEVRNGTPIREAACKYGVPKSTLHYRLKYPEKKVTLGPSPYLTVEEETCLENYIKQLSKKGFPLKKEDLQSSVKRFLTDHPRPNPFIDNYPGEGWVRGFLKRHPSIGTRTSEGVTFSSACVTEADIRKWFAEIREYFEERDLLQVLDDPRRVFNGDESGFQLCPKTGKVLAVKGQKNVYCVETSSSKENMTVMFTFSAAGQSCPPMVVYKYQRIPQKVVESVPSDWGVGRSENGWMTTELFFEYIGNVFHPYLIKEGITLPVIYFLDGHKTHLTYEVSKLCSELQIELIALYPNATRILQPADVAVFRPVKAAWKASTREYLNNNPGQAITKANFAQVLDVALQKSIKPQTLQNGFKACGLVPFDPNAIDFTKCVPTKERAADSINVSNDKTITFSNFLELIGPGKALELRECKNADHTDENFQILHKIYKSFGSPKSAPPKPTRDRQRTLNSNSEVQTSNLPDIAHGSDSDRTLSPTILQNFNKISPVEDCNSDTEFAPLLMEETTQACSKSKIQVLEDILIPRLSDFNSSLCPITGHLMKSWPNSEPEKKQDTEEFSLCPVTGELQTTWPSNEFHQIVQNTPIKEPSKNTSADLEQHAWQTLPQLSEISPAFKVRNSDLGSYLTLPKTPERKGKREVKRMPFAITSAKYKAMYKEQKEIKETETLKKEQRKRLREETKENKEKSKRGKLEGKTKKKIASNTTNTCKICLKATNTHNRVVCDMCSDIFHVKCIPAKHRIHVPQDITIDLFVCHSCYKEDDGECEEYFEPKSDGDISDSEDTVNYLFHEMSMKKY